MRKYLLYKLTAWFLIYWFPCFFIISPVYAQFDDEFQEDLFTDEGEEGDLLDEPAEEEPLPQIEEPMEPEPQEITVEEPEPVEPEPVVEEPVIEEPIVEEPVAPEPEIVEPVFEEPVQPIPTPDDSKMSMVQNAVLEGIQISKEPGESPGENIVTCYFIFRDKPTSYFYETKRKQKLIEFEFSDVVQGSSPIPSVQEAPIQRFKIEGSKVDVNKDVVGLNPEWHDIVKVTFYFDALPKITVKDEYSIISFSFKWSAKGATDEYVDEERSKAPLFIAIFGGIGAAGAAGLVLFFTQDTDDDETRKPLDGIEGVINHPDPVPDQ